MEMQEMASFQLPDDIVQPFTIGMVGDTLAVCAKEQTLVLQLKYKHFAEDGSFNYVLSRFKCSTARPTGQLVANETQLYHAGDIEERKLIMLDQTMFPNLAKVYITNVQSWVSPVGTLEDARANRHLVANLNNMGQLTIYRQHAEWLSSWSPWVDVSTAWIKHFYDGRTITSCERLKTMVYETLITCFCWQDRVHQRPVSFFFGTKSGKLVVGSLEKGEPKIEHVHQQSEASFVLKHVSTTGTDHLLLSAGKSGRVMMYRFNPLSLGSGFKNIITLFDEDLTVSSIECELDSTASRILVLAVKGTFVLAANVGISGKLFGSASLNLEHFMVTGLQQLEPGKYVASTMEGAIFLVHVDRSPDGCGLTLRHQPIKSDLNVSSYGLYGVTTTRTRTCWLFLGYPTRRFDHLTLRTPTCVFFTKFNLREAIEVLQGNRSHRLTDHYDAAEVVRYNGFKNTELLREIDNDKDVLHVELTNSCAYRLKLQLISIGAKLAHHCRRNKSTSEILHNQLQFVGTMIEVISAYHVLSYLADVAIRRGKLNKPQQTAVLCLRHFINSIVEDSFPGDYERVHAELKKGLTKMLRKTATLPMAQYETCSFCDTRIALGKGSCSQEHPVFRCVTTKVQIPLQQGDEIACDMCHRYSLPLPMLTVVFEDVPCAIDYRKCCVCDVQFPLT